MQLHTIKGYIQDIYLVEYPDKLLLLDGACRADIPHLKAFIEIELMRDFADLHTVVVTHMHPDHAGQPTNSESSRIVIWLQQIEIRIGTTASMAY